MLLLVASAFAADDPSYWGATGLAVAGWPTGLLSVTSGQLRTPLTRTGGMVFNDTYAGAGFRVQASPAFVAYGPRFDLAPIDVFDLKLLAARGWWFGNGLGMMPFDELGGTLGSDRSDRRDEAVGAPMWVLSAEPTLKLKLGRIIVFDAWAIDVLRTEKPADVGSPYFYEPLRDLVVAWDDTCFENQAAVLYDALPEGEAFLRVGATFRDRFAAVSGDRSIVVGALAATRPGTKPAVPTVIGIAAWYLVDGDRVGPAPFLAARVNWEIEAPLSP